MVLLLTWLGSAVAAPGFLAKRSLRQGVSALDRRHFSQARRHLERAARYEPLREEAICLMAEACLHDRQPGDALYALNTLLLEQEQLGRGSGSPEARNRSARVRLLRGIAGCLLGRSAVARRELAAIARTDASIDELLAAAQACLMAGDASGAQQLLEQLEGPIAAGDIAGELLARVKLCRAALYYRLGAWERCLKALPAERECSPADAVVCRRVREALKEPSGGAGAMAKSG